VSVVALQPLDTVLTRWQAQAQVAVAAPPPGIAVARVGAAANAAGADGLSLEASLRAARSLASRAGFRALWRGSGPMVGAVPVQNALLMGGYGVGMGWVDPDHPDRMAAIFAGGCAGGVLQSFLMSPVEYAKVRAQIREPGAPPIPARDMAARLSANVRTGLGATLLRDGIPHGVWFVAYEAAKRHLQERQQPPPEGGSSFSSSLVPPLGAGAFAAAAAWIVGYPADLIKTRLQSGASTGIVLTARTIVREHGWRGLYRGLGLKLVRAVPASMIGFGTYEFVKAEISASP
jgi:solute carrier family 25 carnitine/acylcarnitine transporter 20/29